MRIQVILHQLYLVGITVMFTDDFIDKLCIVLFGALFPDLRITYPFVYIISQQYYTGAFPAILMIYPLWHARLHGQGRHHLTQELAGAFIHAQPYRIWCCRLLIQTKHPFHIGQVLTIYFANTPVLLEPGLELTFFKTLRTVSSLR